RGRTVRVGVRAASDIASRRGGAFRLVETGATAPTARNARCEVAVAEPLLMASAVVDVGAVGLIRPDAFVNARAGARALEDVAVVDAAAKMGEVVVRVERERAVGMARHAHRRAAGVRSAVRALAVERVARAGYERHGSVLRGHDPERLRIALTR